MGLSAVSASKQAQDSVVKAIEAAEDTLVRVRAFRQQSEAQAYAFEKLNSIKALADQDTDFDAAKYETEIDKVGMEATRTISGRLAKDEFMAQFQRQATALKWGIKNDFRAKELQAADATIEYQGQQIIDTYGGMDDAMKMSSVANYKTQLENAVKVGLYNKGTADLKWAEFQKKVFTGQVKWDI
jgi:predicted trehalose synthase